MAVEISKINQSGQQLQREKLGVVWEGDGAGEGREPLSAECLVTHLGTCGTGTHLSHLRGSWACEKPVCHRRAAEPT